MKRLACCVVILVTQGCAFKGAYFRQEVAQEDARVQSLQAQVAAYHQDPHDKLLIVVTSETTAFGSIINPRIECHQSITTMKLSDDMSRANANTSSQTFTARTPYIHSVSFGAELDKVRQTHLKGTPTQQRQAAVYVDVASPVNSFTAQNENDYGHLKAEAYFDGKKLASDETTVGYGAVSLNFKVPFADALAQGTVQP